MDLSDYELMPGVIASVKDDECLGRIKVSIPGSETPANCTIEAMPWCYPISMTGTYQGFTKMLEGAKVWVLRNKTDNLEMWYWPMFDLNPNTEEIVASYDNTEVIVSRDLGGANVYIYYTDSKGIWLSIGGTKINITPKGSIELITAGGGQIKIDGENVLLNTDGLENNAVRERQLTECLKKITECIETIVSASNCNWSTHHISQQTSPKLTELKQLFTSEPGWKCPNVGVN